MEEEQPENDRMIEAMTVIDLDPSFAIFRPTEQKWVSSLELLTEAPKESRNNQKILHLGPAVFLQVGYSEKNRPPVYDIDFLGHPSSEWIALKSPASIRERLSGNSLCYRAGDSCSLQPVAEIEVLKTQRKRVNEEKEVFILPAGFKIVNNNPISQSYLIFRRMKSPLEQTYQAGLAEKYPPEYQGVSLEKMHEFCFPEGVHLSKELKGFINFNFTLTNQSGERFHCNCLTFKESMSQPRKQEMRLPVHEPVFSEKALCLISRYRYTDEFSECLKHLYRLSMSKNDVPFHRVVSSFVDGLRMPRQLGIIGASYSYGGSNITFETNPSYPIVSERAIYCIFKFLPLSAILSVFQAILLEKKVVFVSQSKTVLGYAVEAFLAFIFPFRWELVLIPLLPSAMADYLAAPVPLIAGISPQMLECSIESDSIIVQLDSGTLLNDEDLPPLPDKMEKQLRKRLEPFQIYDEEEVKEYLENPESTYIFKMQEVQHPGFQGALVRDCFFEFLLTLMKNYRKFWKNQKYRDSKENSSIGLTEPQLTNDVFRLHDFLSDLGMTKVGSFGYKLTESALFNSFIERRYQFAEDPEFLFFDSCIDKKRGKKETKLLEKPSNIRYTVASHPEPESSKKIYHYDSFPSILDQSILKQEEISLQVDTLDEAELQALEEFFQNEFLHHRSLFSQARTEDMEIESLLLKNFKIKFEDHCQHLGNRLEPVRNSFLGKPRNQRDLFDRLSFFQKLYVEQQLFIESVFEEWPTCGLEEGPKELSKREYLKNQVEGFGEEQLVAVFEEYEGCKFRNFETLLCGNVRINLLAHREESSQLGYEFSRSSKKRIKHSYEIYIRHFKLKNFINRVMPVHGRSFFRFALRQLQEYNAADWTIDTLFSWRQSLKITSN